MTRRFRRNMAQGISRVRSGTQRNARQRTAPCGTASRCERSISVARHRDGALGHLTKHEAVNCLTNGERGRVSESEYDLSITLVL